MAAVETIVSGCPPTDHGTTMTLGTFEVELRDGRRALVRPILPEDKERLQRGLRLLSPRSRFLRFHTPVTELSAAELRYLTEIDYVDHMAWVALDPERPDDPGMAVARYVRLVDEPSVAEAAITVADACQGNGLGSILLDVLGGSARSHGIRTFRSYVLAENEGMLRIFERIGARTERGDDGIWRVEVDLEAETPEAAAETGAGQEAERTPLARAVLRSVARGELPTMPMIDPPCWMQRSDRDRVVEGRPRGNDRRGP